MKEALLDQALLKEIALQVVQQGILSNCWFYVALIALSLLSGAAGAFLSKYWGKRGETAAVDADLKKILRQLKKTTEVAEQVRSKVDHADWVAREWKTIRRVKLEELVQSAISVKQWVDEQYGAWMDLPILKYVPDERKNNNESKRNLPNPAEHVVMIAALYFSEFPEIQTLSNKLLEISDSAKKFAVDTCGELIPGALQEDVTQMCSVYSKPKMEEMAQHLDAVSDAISKCKEKAAEIMRDMQTN